MVAMSPTTNGHSNSTSPTNSVELDDEEVLELKYFTNSIEKQRQSSVTSADGLDDKVNREGSLKTARGAVGGTREERSGSVGAGEEEEEEEKCESAGEDMPEGAEEDMCESAGEDDYQSAGEDVCESAGEDVCESAGEEEDLYSASMPSSKTPQDTAAPNSSASAEDTTQTQEESNGTSSSVAPVYSSEDEFQKHLDEVRRRVQEKHRAEAANPHLARANSATAVSQGYEAPSQAVLDDEHHKRLLEVRRRLREKRLKEGKLSTSDENLLMWFYRDVYQSAGEDVCESAGEEEDLYSASMPSSKTPQDTAAPNSSASAKDTTQTQEESNDSSSSVAPVYSSEDEFQKHLDEVRRRVQEKRRAEAANPHLARANSATAVSQGYEAPTQAVLDDEHHKRLLEVRRRLREKRLKEGKLSTSDENLLMWFYRDVYQSAGEDVCESAGEEEDLYSASMPSSKTPQDTAAPNSSASAKDTTQTQEESNDSSSSVAPVYSSEDEFQKHLDEVRRRVQEKRRAEAANPHLARANSATAVSQGYEAPTQAVLDDEHHKRLLEVRRRLREKRLKEGKLSTSDENSLDEDGIDEPEENVDQVMSSLLAQFLEFTGCEDAEVAGRYIRHAQMDVNDAIMMYLNAS